MASCLGLYIENNLIKYAKVSKERDNLKVEAFGIRFFDDLNKTIEQIVEETYSYKTPISINLSDEMYTYFDVFSLLGKNYLPKVVQTEFESYCVDKGYNPNVFETRYALVENIDDKEKLRVINISANKLELNRRATQLERYRLSAITPISMAITNIADLPEKENAIIVNMEENTIITTVTDRKIYDIDILDEGSTDVLSKINIKENSYAKAYEACKNTTIYTAEGRELGTEQTYLSDVMPTINQIVSYVSSKIDSSLAKIKKVYLTGTLTTVNNIDLYFQEYLTDVECKTLRPNFITTEGNEINIREYIEVNSAIALAIQGLEMGVTGMNFKRKSLSDILKSDIGSNSKAKTGKAKSSVLDMDVNLKDFLTFDLGEKLTGIEKNLLRTAVGLLIFIIVYSGLSSFLTKQIHKKEDEVNTQITQTEEQINLAKADKGKIDTKTNEYKEMTKALQEINDRASDVNQSRNIIPNLLNQIMFVIPENVQITSIENTTSRHIVIVAQSDKYEPLGYFKAKLSSDRILYDVVSNSGVSDGNVIKVTIEGDL